MHNDVAPELLVQVQPRLVIQEGNNACGQDVIQIVILIPLAIEMPPWKGEEG